MMKTYNFKIANMDTDSISFSKEDESPFNEEEQVQLLLDLNSNFPDKIRWENDGIYETVVILKAKNYILYQNGKIKKKGSSLKSSKTEKALTKFMDEVISALVFDKKDTLLSIYNKYIKEVNTLKDITPWTSKKTITDKVMNPQRTNEQKVLDALKGKQVQMGDKVWLYFASDSSLQLAESWNGNHDVVHLMKRIYNTLNIFKNVIDITQFPKYHLKNKKIKEQLEIMLNEI